MESFRQLNFVGDVRYIGMVGSVELVADKKTALPFDPAKRAGQQIFKKALKERLILRPLGDVIYLFPPLCITERQLTDILKKMFKVISSLTC
jgi:adenosylmethionine-8-amino-7-oxononanoate aminotransferase